MKSSYMIYAEVIIHSFGLNKADYEVIDISFDDEYNVSQEIYEKNSERALEMDALRELAIEELDEYGETICEIHTELCEKYGNEYSCRVRVGLDFESYKVASGEIEVDVDYEYDLVETEVDIEPYL